MDATAEVPNAHRKQAGSGGGALNVTQEVCHLRGRVPYWKDEQNSQRLSEMLWGKGKFGRKRSSGPIIHVQRPVSIRDFHASVAYSCWLEN